MSARLTAKDHLLRSMSEADFQETVIKLARVYGWRVAHFRPVRIQRKDGSTYYETPVAADGKGWPDLALVRRERLILAELKRMTGAVEPEQWAWFDALSNTRAEVYIWRPDEMDAIERCLQ